jgi:hypothetical protein
MHQKTKCPALSGPVQLSVRFRSQILPLFQKQKRKRRSISLIFMWFTKTVSFLYENDAIGIIICKEKNRTIVEYSLKTSSMPIGVSTYTTTPKLPKDYKHLLPDSKIISKKIDQLFGEQT